MDAFFEKGENSTRAKIKREREKKKGRERERETNFLKVTILSCGEREKNGEKERKGRKKVRRFVGGIEERVWLRSESRTIQT